MEKETPEHVRYFLGCVMHPFFEPPIHSAQERSAEVGCKKIDGHFEKDGDRVGDKFRLHKLDDRFRADLADAFKRPAGF